MVIRTVMPLVVLHSQRQVKQNERNGDRAGEMEMRMRMFVWVFGNYKKIYHRFVVCKVRIESRRIEKKTVHGVEFDPTTRSMQ